MRVRLRLDSECTHTLLVLAAHWQGAVFLAAIGLLGAGFYLLLSSIP